MISNKLQIYSVVVKNFLLALQNAGLYYKFKKILQSKVIQNNNESNLTKYELFGSAIYLNWICADIDNILEGVYPRLKTDGTVYEFIGITINVLIRHYVDIYDMVPREQLQTLGSHIFDKSRQQLFG